jgi:methylenetetrahydrofolate--tRNA-(uracil-5-)-methyltransferase
MDIVFRASRYGKETMEGAGDEGAYLNCPMSREEYEAFLDALSDRRPVSNARIRPGAVFRGLHADRSHGATRS